MSSYLFIDNLLQLLQPKILSLLEDFLDHTHVLVLRNLLPPLIRVRSQSALVAVEVRRVEVEVEVLRHFYGKLKFDELNMSEIL